MKTDLIPEEKFIQTMKQEIEPALNEQRTVLWAKRNSGQNIYCERYLAENPRGVVLISHGFKESAAKYAEPIWYFLREGYHVYIPEHCGHGRSYRLVDDLSLVHVDSYQRYVNDLLAVARMVRSDVDRTTGGDALPMFLFAHSMGGGIGIDAAACAPDLFEKIVLSAPMIQPQTGSFTFRQTAVGSAFLCAIGLSKRYCPGHHPYQGPENFADSASLSRPRFDYYQEIKAKTPLFQTSAASIGWIHASVLLKHELMTKSVKNGGTPMLLFQAGQDGSVSVEAQNDFFRTRNDYYPGSIIFRKLPGTKHEIYNSPNGALAPFWDEVFDYLS